MAVTPGLKGLTPRQKSFAKWEAGLVKRFVRTK